jgi:hypothetical protein
LGRGGIANGNVGDDSFEMLNRFLGPEDLRQISRPAAASADGWGHPTIAATVSRRHG